MWQQMGQMLLDGSPHPSGSSPGASSSAFRSRASMPDTSSIAQAARAPGQAASPRPAVARMRSASMPLQQYQGAEGFEMGANAVWPCARRASGRQWRRRWAGRAAAATLARLLRSCRSRPPASSDETVETCRHTCWIAGSWSLPCPVSSHLKLPATESHRVPASMFEMPAMRPGMIGVR